MPWSSIIHCSKVFEVLSPIALVTTELATASSIRSTPVYFLITENIFCASPPLALNTLLSNTQNPLLLSAYLFTSCKNDMRYEYSSKSALSSLLIPLCSVSLILCDSHLLTFSTLLLAVPLIPEEKLALSLTQASISKASSLVCPFNAVIPL